MLATQASFDDVLTLGTVWKANEVRYEINGDSSVTKSIPAYNAWLNTQLDYLDTLLPVFKRAGILCLVDIHTPPGGMDSQNHNVMFSDKQWQACFVAMWEKIALRYRGSEQIWGYDLCNEPIVGDVPAGLLGWHDLAELTARKVRHIDPTHAIIVEPDPGAEPSGLDNFGPINVPGIVYSIHMYDPHTYTQQGIYEATKPIPYPGVVDGQNWDKQTIRATLQPAIDFAHDYNAQIYVGEFSAVRWAPGAVDYLKDCIDIFEENGWDWDYHAWREWQGWSAEIGEDENDTSPSKTTTDRGLLLQSWFAKNVKPSEK
jgi:aryl-phospho-beta-D-glucosidase BglC (GH1 family)